MKKNYFVTHPGFEFFDFTKLTVFLFLFANIGLLSAQVVIPEFEVPCSSMVVNFSESSDVPACVEAGAADYCNRKYVEVKLQTTGFHPVDEFNHNQPYLFFYLNFASIDLIQELFVTSTQNPVPFSRLNAEASCFIQSIFPNATLSVVGNQVEYQIVKESSEGVVNTLLFSRNANGDYESQTLYFVAIDAFAGEEISLDCVSSTYISGGPAGICNIQFCNAYNYTAPTPHATEANVCVRPGDYDPATDLLNIEIANNSNAVVSLEYLTVPFKIDADQIMNTPSMLNFTQSPSETPIITQIPGTDDYAGFVRFAFSPALQLQSGEVQKLFDIYIKGPVNESILAQANVCLLEGESRRSGTGQICNKSCFDPECKEITYGVAEACDPPKYSISVEPGNTITCNTLSANVGFNYGGLSHSFEQILITVEFDLPPTVNIINAIPGTLGCPTSNSTCQPNAGFNNCMRIDGNRVTYCYFPSSGGNPPINTGTYFTVNFSAPMGCVNGATVVESLVDPEGSTPPCVALTPAAYGFPLCTPIFAGKVRNSNNVYIDDVIVNARSLVTLNNCTMNMDIIPENAPWAFCPCSSAEYQITPEVRWDAWENWLNGVSTYDNVLIGRHIWNIELFTSPYQYIAADVSGSGLLEVPSVNTQLSIDQRMIKDLLTGVTNRFPTNNSWRYIDADFVINLSDFSPSNLDQSWKGIPSNTDVDFVAVKIGDVNNTHNADWDMKPQMACNLSLPVTVPLEHQDLITIPVRYDGTAPSTALQLALRFNAADFDFYSVTPGDFETIQSDCFGKNFVDQGELRFSWFTIWENEFVEPGQILLYLTLRAKHDIPASDQPIIDIDETNLPARAWLTDGTPYLLRTVALPEASFDRTSAKSATQSIQAAMIPNPSAGAFRLQVQSERQINRAVLAVFDGQGSRLMRKELSLQPGNNEFLLSESERWPAGVYLWKIKSGEVEAEGRVVRE